MIGYGPNKGVIPIVCDQIFKKVKNNQQTNKSFQITVSMMEIYNQTVRDLLSVKNTDLKICQNKKYGVYVQGLIKHPVHSYQQIQRRIQEGSNNRSIAATLMNESSSRSHTIVSINFMQKIQVTKAQMTFKYSVINLVDLAGSQCVAKTGAVSKDRLRQTAKINQSLSTLGRVIEALAENSSKVDKTHVPYRDSKLTFILRNALGGNSQTAMICAISPADDNFQQTLSTLRYANRAKKIQNKAIINQSDVDKLIRMLRQQNQMLKKMLKQMQWSKTVINQQTVHNTINYMNNGLLMPTSMGFENNQQSLLDSDYQDIPPENQLQTSFKQVSGPTVDLNQPYITNLSQDEQLSFRVKYSCINLLIGNKSGDPKPDVILAALGIKPHHARIWQAESQILIEPLQDGASDYIFLNGENLLARAKLYNLDRIIFGSGCIFLVRIPGGQPRKPIEEKDIDYQLAISQMNIPGMGKSVLEQGQIRKQIFQEIQAQYEKNRQQNQQKLKKQMQEQQQNYHKKLKQIQELKNSQTLKLQQQLKLKQIQAKNIQQQRRKAQQQVQKYLLLQQQLKKQKQQKKAYQETVKILEQKKQKMKQLQDKLANVLSKEEEMKVNIVKQEEIIRRQLEVKTIMCTNQNILNQYKLQYSKRARNAQELRDLFVKRQKIQLQKQLIALVPLVERFNLIAKQMHKRIDSGLSVRYKFISYSEIAEVLKNGAYKGKFQINIHVNNRQEGRSYYWPSQIFKNRYELALQLFELYINDPKHPKILDKQSDPYWDPPEFQTIGCSFLMIQSLFYGLSFKGKINIINQGKQLGQMQVNLYPCNLKGQQISLDQRQSIQIQSPRQLMQKNVTFCLQINKLILKKDYQKILIQYQLVQDNYRLTKYKTSQSQVNNLKYQMVHTLKDLSENTILHYSQKPILFQIKSWPKIIPENQRDDIDFKSNYSSFAESPDELLNQSKVVNDLKQFIEVSPPKMLNPRLGSEKGIVFDNTQVLNKIEKQYNYKKSLIEKKKERQQQWIKNNNTKGSRIFPKDKDCLIF